MDSLNFISTNQYYQAIFVILVSFVAVFIMRLSIKLYAMKVSRKTKTDIDDLMIGAIRTPLSLLILSTGLYLALKFMPNYGIYSLWADKIFFVICVLLVSVIFARLADILMSRWFNKNRKNRSEEHTSELQSHSFISYAVFCLKKKK